MKTVAIVGIGLIGGSLGQALRRTRRYRVLGIARKPRTLRDAKRLGAIDSGSTHLEDAAQADIVVIATPVDNVVPTARKLFPLLKPGTIVTDVSSVKGAILDGIRRLSKRDKVSFVGAHPLAGSHKTGVKAANANLFRRSTCVIVPLGKAPVNAITTLWRAVGARPRILSAASHDSAVAVTSHLPHLVAHALVLTFARRSEGPLLRSLLAGSFRDGTRVASSDPDQWAQIMTANAAALRRAIREFTAELKRLEKSLGTSRLKAFLRRSHALRRPLYHGV